MATTRPFFRTRKCLVSSCRSQARTLYVRSFTTFPVGNAFPQRYSFLSCQMEKNIEIQTYPSRNRKFTYNKVISTPKITPSTVGNDKMYLKSFNVHEYTLTRFYVFENRQFHR